MANELSQEMIGSKIKEAFLSSNLNKSNKSKVLGAITQLAQYDQEKAGQIYGNYNALKRDSNSVFYDPYSAPTNQAVSNLAALGFDTNNLNRGFIDQNRQWISSNLIYSGTTNTPSKPGKKATADQRLAYELYQWDKSEEQTAKAEQEYQDVLNEARYWTSRTDRNYSDDEIVGKVKENFAKKYPTLAKMQDSGFQPLELNRAVDYSDDTLYGAIWAERNGYDWNMDAAIGYNALGVGEQWKLDPKIAAKLDSNDPAFNPYSVGSTNVDDAALFFGVSKFDKDWLQKNDGMQWNGTEEQKAMYKKVQTAEENTLKAEAALDALDKWLGKMKKTKPEDAKKALDRLLAKGSATIDGTTVDLSILNKMDVSVGKEGKPGTGDLLSMTRGVDYKYDEFLQKAYDVCEKNANKESGLQIQNNPAGTSAPAQQAPAATNAPEQPAPTAPAAPEQPASAAPVMTESDIEADKAKTGKSTEAYDTVSDTLTENESAVWQSAPAVSYEQTVNFWNGLKKTGGQIVNDMATELLHTNVGGFIDNSMQASRDVSVFETTQAELEADRKSFDEYKTKYGDIELLQKEFKPQMTATMGDYTVDLVFDDAKNAYTVGQISINGTDLAEYAELDIGLINQVTADANQVARDETAKALQVKKAHDVLDAAGKEGADDLKAYAALNAKIQREEKYIADNQANYDEQKVKLSNARGSLRMMRTTAEWLGLDTSSVDQAEAVLDFLVGYYDQPQLPRSEMTKGQALDYYASVAGKELTATEKSAACKEGIEKIDKEIDSINMVLEYLDNNKYQIPDNVRRNMQYRLEDLKVERQGYEYAAMMADAKPEEKEKAIDAGKAFEEKYADYMDGWQMSFGNGNKANDCYTLMVNPQYSGEENMYYTDDKDVKHAIISEEDQDMYYYLLGQKVMQYGDQFSNIIDSGSYNVEETGALLHQILDEANGYAEYMNNDDYGVWTTRKHEYQKDYAAGLVNSGFWGGVAANAASTLVTPMESVASAIYLVDRAITGKRINPDSGFRSLTTFKEATREETFKSIDETFKDNPVMKNIARIGYEIYSNRGDSLMNSLTFGWMAPGSGMLSEIAGASPMGMTAALTAAAHAIERGADMDQAWAIAGITFLSETVTEGVTYSNIKEALGVTGELTKDSLKSFVLDWLKKSGVEEALGESFNDVAESWIDGKVTEWFDNPNFISEHEERIRKYIAEGYGDDAEKMAYVEEAKDVMHTALVSYLSAGTDVFTKVGKSAINTFNAYRGFTKADQRRGGSNSILDNMVKEWKNGKTAPAQGAETQTEQETETQTEQTETQTEQAETAQPSGETQQETTDNHQKLETKEERMDDAAPAKKTESTPEQQEAAKDIANIERSKGGDQSAQTAAVSSALNTGENTDATNDRANAASAYLGSVLRGDVSTTMQEVIRGAAEAGVDGATVKKAMQNAALGNGAATALVQSDAFQQMTPQEKAKALADTVALDDTNVQVQQTIESKVKDYRATRVMADMAANGHFDQAEAAQEAAEKAAENTANARTMLEEKQGEADAAVQNLQTIDQQFQENPSEENGKQRADAVTRVNNADVAEHQMEQHLANEEAAQRDAEEKARKAKEDATNAARETANATIAQTNQQRADAAMRAAEEKKNTNGSRVIHGTSEDGNHIYTIGYTITTDTEHGRNLVEFSSVPNESAQEAMKSLGMQAVDRGKESGETRGFIWATRDGTTIDSEQIDNALHEADKKQMQAEEEERTGKAQEDRDDAVIEGILDREGLEEGEERDTRREKLKNQLDKVKIKLKDLKKPLSTTEGALALYAFERKLGIPIIWKDLGTEARAKYEYDENTKQSAIILNENLRNKMHVGQAIVQAALHEITHSMQNTNAYKTYRNVVLESIFGVKNASDAVTLYQENADFRAKVDQMIVERELAGDPNFTGDDENKKIIKAEEEIIADFARLNLNELDVIQRFMDNGLGGRMRNALHNINQALKNYLSGLSDEDRQQAEYFRRAERAFQKAMNEVAKTTVHPDASQFSIAQVAQSAGMRFDAEKRILYDKDGNEIDGVKYKIKPEDMVKTPVGFLIRSGLNLTDGDNAEQAKNQPGYVDPTSTAGKALDMMTGLMNMIARYKDSDLVWEIGASTLSSTFSALKSNSDTQYQTTVDFGTICAKTQAIVDVMSQVMLDKIDPETGMLKEGMKPGLTRKEIMKVYDATHNAKLSVPCPVCYVFSRWMGVPSLLGQMSQFQKDHVVTMKGEDGKPLLDKNGRMVIDWDATQKHVDEYVSDMLGRYGSKDAINNKKTRLQGRLKTLEERRNALEESLYDKTLSKDEKAEIRKQIDELLDDQTKIEDELGEVRAFNWVSQALCVDDGKFQVDRKHFRVTPDSVIFDMNRTSEFAEDDKNWTYRTTRGAGMGKAINPYSGETIGDILYGVNKQNKGRRQNGLRNPWLNYVEGGKNTSAATQLRNARKRAKQQNLLGGQRLQSTSDFRPEWGLDYVMSFLELQAAGSKVQMYTKVAEAIDFFASVGADVNMSIMGKGTGWREATADEIAKMTPEEREAATLNDKVYVLEFSDVTGMPFYDDEKTGRKGALHYKNKYDNVQMILVGMNDTHIRLAMKNKDIDFIIPWHSSGNSKEVLSGLISAVGEKLNTSVDYTTTQSDMKKGETKSYYDEDGNKVEYSAPGEQTEQEKQLWDLRMRILTGKANDTEAKGGFTAEERNLVYKDPWLRQLYDRFYVKGVDDSCYGVKLSGKQAGQIFPYEYWANGLVFDEETHSYKHDPNQKGATKATADENGKRFVAYCERMGIIPRFSQFKDDPGYWKLLIDRPMYNNSDGTYHEQQTINVTNARIGQLDESGKLDKSTTDLPSQAQAVYAPKDKRNPMYEEYMARENNAVMAAEEALGIPYTEKQTEAMDDANAIQTTDDVYRDGVDKQLSVYGEQNEGDIDMLSQANEDYKAAIERGDMKAAQEDVDFVAAQAGYDTTTTVYHATANGGRFNAFDPLKLNNSKLSSQIGQGFYFTNSKSGAEEYLNNHDVYGRVSRGNAPYLYEGYLKINNPLEITEDSHNLTYDEIRNIIAEGGYQWFLNSGMAHDIQGETINGQKYTIDEIKGMSQEERIDLYSHYLEEHGDKFALQHMVDAYSYTNQGALLKAMQKYTGHDGVHWQMKEGLDQYVIFDSSQFKESAPVTYDDQGNPIPLNKRFNAENQDIRYSTGGEKNEGDMDRFEYMKPFDQQIDDYVSMKDAIERGETNVVNPFGESNSILVGGTPENLKLIGLPSLPLTINQEHLAKCLYGEGVEEKYIPGHTFPIEEFKKLPEKIANPIAIGYDPQSTKQVIVYVDMQSNNGDQVIVPMKIGGAANIGDIESNVLKLDTAFSPVNNTGLNLLKSAIVNDGKEKNTLFYLDKEKAIECGVAPDILNTKNLTASRLIHMITDANSDVKIDVPFWGKGKQFGKWFGKSKVVNDDGSPMIVYHGTSENFTVFDMSKGRATMDIQGAFFSPWAEESAGYGENVGAYYLSIKKPASANEAYKALNMFKGQNEAGKKAKEYLINKGYDGVIDETNGEIYEIIAFYPEQIKSATDNIGTFDRNNPDYRYSMFGETNEGDLDADEQEMNDTLLKAGVLTQEEIDAYNEMTSRPQEGKSAKWSLEEGPAQRQFGGEEGMLQVSEIEQKAIDYVQQHNAYFPDTNAGQIMRAINWIRKNGSKKNDDGTYTQETDGFAESLQKVTSKSFDYRSADGQARMIATMAMAVAKNDVAAQVALADSFNRQGTDLGRALQSRKIFRMMTPSGRIASIQKMMTDVQDELAAKGKKIDLKFSDWIYMAASAAENEADFAKVQQAAATELANQLPISWKDRLQSFRMLSMLANPRTHIRNVIGNAMFVPAVGLKNKMSALMELGMKKGDRTKTLAPILSKEARDFARQDAIAMQAELTGEAKYNEQNNVKSAQKPLGKIGGFLSDFNSNMLEKEDWLFLKGHYRRALGGWMMANGYTAEQLQNDPALLEKGRTYAIQEAQKATYRDFNKTAQTLNQLSRKGGAVGFLVDATLPFKKTPANILRRGIEYSPVGIFKSLTTDMYHMKQYLDYQNGKLNVLPEKALSPNQVIDHFCSGLSGTGIMALGWLLSGAGAVSSGLDDDEDKFEKAKGNQDYAINPGKALNSLFGAKLFGEDVTYTIDWAAPMSMPFFVGAAIREQMENEGSANVEDFLNAVGGMTEPVFNLSMLDGVNTLFKTSSYDNSENPITQILSKIGTNYVSSFVPSALGAATRTFFDDTRRKSFVPQGQGSGSIGNARYAIENAQNKIPGLSKQNIPARDIWGNAETSPFIERLVENFISPGYINEYKEDPIINEMARLYDATGDKSMIPEIDPSKSYTYTKNGVKNKVVFTDKEWDQYKETRGKTAFTELTELINSQDYQNADNATQIKMIDGVWDHANKVGLKAVIPDLDVKETSIGTIAADSRVAVNKNKLIDSLKSGDYEGYEDLIEALHNDGVEDSEIKNKIATTYRDQYKSAYLDGNYEEMAEIEDILDNTGFDFDYDKWQEQADEKR